MHSKKIYMAARCILGVVFIVSGTIKLGDLKSFGAAIDAFAIVPAESAFLLGVLIAFTELFAGIGLVFDIRATLGIIAVLLTGFILVLGWALYMGYDIDCGCFGPDDPEAKAFSGIKGALFRDAMMLAAVFYLYAWRRINSHTPFNPFNINPVRKRSLNNDVSSN